MNIPIYKPWITDLEREYMARAIESGWLSSKGEYIGRFEEEFAKYIGVKYALAVDHGTSACHLALLASGIGPGDEVIIPNLTFIATANAVKYCQATPVIVDVDQYTWNIDLDLITEDIVKKGKTKAIFCVHLLGNPCNYRQLIDVCREHNIMLIEDACESIGAKSYTNDAKDTFVHTGAYGTCAAFSFYGNKVLTCGEGGMLTTNCKDVYDMATRLRGSGQKTQYYHDIIGYNYKMTNVQAALGCAQLERIGEILAEKKRVYNTYVDAFVNSFQLQETSDGEHGTWMFALCLNGQDKVERVTNELRQAGIDSRPMFYPLTDMDPYQDIHPIEGCYAFDSRAGLDGESMSQALHKTVLMLPSYPELTDDELHYIIRLVKQYGL